MPDKGTSSFISSFLPFPLSEPTDFWVGVEYDLDHKQWRTMETKVQLQDLDRPDACLYPGFVGTDYKPKDVEQCLVMTGTAWQSTPGCKREDAIRAICEYGKPVASYLHLVHGVRGIKLLLGYLVSFKQPDAAQNVLLALSCLMACTQVSRTLNPAIELAHTEHYVHLRSIRAYR